MSRHSKANFAYPQPFTNISAVEDRAKFLGTLNPIPSTPNNLDIPATHDRMISDEQPQHQILSTRDIPPYRRNYTPRYSQLSLNL